VRDRDESRVGRFACDLVSGTWEWDDEVFRIHGLEPGSISPTTEYVLNCKHPEDRERVAAVIAQASKTGAPFSISYRLIGADGVERRVVLVCEGGICEDDRVTSIDGYYVDLTADFREEREEFASEAVAASAEHRAIIEQAKGSLMLAYGLDADQAFAMLNWWSSHRNMKVRDLAARLVATWESGSATTGDLRKRFDALLDDITTSATP
jgi:ANTAR domain-containing protein/PAS domain-containing protein